jgi:hypothetical protein
MGKSVQCWLPAQFKKGWEEYAEDYCFVENTYWLPFNERIPTNTTMRDERMLNYYQWVPFVLALMAAMFYLPHLLWRSLNFLSGLSVRSVVSMAAASTDKQSGDRKDVVGLVAGHMREAMRVQTALSGSGNPLSWVLSCGMTKGWYIIFVYIIIKLLFLLNIVAQFYILLSFLGPNHEHWGFGILSDLATETRQWEDSGHFPRVTLCDFEVRVLGNVQRFTAQCVLMINMFNEKIFLFLWWWFVMLGVVTTASLLYWILFNFIPYYRTTFVRKMLETQGYPRKSNEGHVSEFVSSFIRPDGVFVLRLMSGNAGDMVTSQVVCKMWEDYLDEKRKTSTRRTLPNAPLYPALNDVDAPPIDL